MNTSHRLMKLIKRTPRRAGGPAEHPLEPRLRQLEREVETLRREAATLNVELMAANQRFSAAVDLTEQRLDNIHRQVVLELKRAFDLGVASIETDRQLDAKLADLFSAGLEVKVDVEALDMKAILSGQIRPGRVRPPFTLQGFRIDRRRARELGDCIEVLSIDEAGPGTAVYGPYKRLVPGRYAVRAILEKSGGTRLLRARGDIALDVYSPAAQVVLGSAAERAADLGKIAALSVQFEWDSNAATDTVEIRLHQRSDQTFRLQAFELDRLDSSNS